MASASVVMRTGVLAAGGYAYMLVDLRTGGQTSELLGIHAGRHADGRKDSRAVMHISR